MRNATFATLLSPEVMMRHLSRFVLPLVLTVTTIGLTLTYGQGTPKADPPKKEEAKKLTVMERKLLHSQRILEGLAMNNFEKVAKAADELLECVKDATWRINDTEEYLTFSKIFQRDIEDIKKAVEKKNIDAASLAYGDMTRTCVKCHKYLRETRIGGAKGPDNTVSGY
jgi:urease gamma subunit